MTKRRRKPSVNENGLTAAQKLVPSKKRALKAQDSADFKQTTEEKIAIYHARLDFNMKAMLVFTPLYGYGTAWKQISPLSFQTHLDFLDRITTEYNIPYDPEFQRFYLGSFAGAASIFMASQMYAEGFNKIKTAIKDGYINVSEIPKYDTSTHGLNHSDSRNAFAVAALGLTAVETFYSYAPNRSFDYGDMAAYALAAALYIGGLSLVTRRASQKFRDTPNIEGPK